MNSLILDVCFALFIALCQEDSDDEVDGDDDDEDDEENEEDFTLENFMDSQVRCWKIISSHMLVSLHRL